MGAADAMKMEPAKNFGEITVTVTFRTGTCGGSEPEPLLKRMFEELVQGLRDSERLRIWSALVDGVRYEPFKPEVGGAVVEYRPPKRRYDLDVSGR